MADRKIRKREHARVYLHPGDDGMTKQSFRDECDINKILPKAAATGLMSHVNRAQGSMRDLSEAVDYKTGLDLINEAEEAFMELPARLRKEYDNDPGKLLAAIEDPEQHDRLYELGLAERPDKPEEVDPDKQPIEEPIEVTTPKPSD